MICQVGNPFLLKLTSDKLSPTFVQYKNSENYSKFCSNFIHHFFTRTHYPTHFSPLLKLCSWVPPDLSTLFFPVCPKNADNPQQYIFPSMTSQEESGTSLGSISQNYAALHPCGFGENSVAHFFHLSISAWLVIIAA